MSVAGLCMLEIIKDTIIRTAIRLGYITIVILTLIYAIVCNSEQKVNIWTKLELLTSSIQKEYNNGFHNHSLICLM